MTAGTGFVVGVLSSCASVPWFATRVEQGTIRVPISVFKESGIVVVQPDNLEYDICLRKRTDGTYLALLLRCTHANTPVSPSPEGFACPLHGSTFDAEGRVQRGPAFRPLDRFATSIEGDVIIIRIQST